MKTTQGWLCAAALLVPALAGCGGSSSSTNSPPVLVPHSVSATLSNGLTATLTEDRSAVSVGGAVTYTMMLTNNTAQAVTYQSYVGPGNYPTVPAALVVSNPSNQIVYPLGVFPNFVSIGPPVTLLPGQSVSATQAVSTTRDAGLTVTQGYSAAGTYTANAHFSVIPGTTLNATQTAITATAGPLPVTAQ